MALIPRSEPTAERKVPKVRYERLVLFDIDGTLLRCGPQVRPLFVDSLIEVFGGCGSVDGFDFAGKTDPQIVLDLMSGSGREDDDIRLLLPSMRQRYLVRLEAGLRRERMRLLPGVVELLEHLTASPKTMIGLLTGNWRGGAAIKLGRFGLGGYFDFGAFGDDAEERRALVPLALERANERNIREFATSEVLIVGDTVRDVDCARASGVSSLGVATGFTAAERLREAGADWVFDDLVAAKSRIAQFAGLPS